MIIRESDSRFPTSVFFHKSVSPNSNSNFYKHLLRYSQGSVYCRCSILTKYEKTLSRNCSHFSPLSNISLNFRKKSKWPKWDTQGFGVNCFMKNLRSKILCQTPFNQRKDLEKGAWLVMKKLIFMCGGTITPAGIILLPLES